MCELFGKLESNSDGDPSKKTKKESQSTCCEGEDRQICSERREKETFEVNHKDKRWSQGVHYYTQVGEIVERQRQVFFQSASAEEVGENGARGDSSSNEKLIKASKIALGQSANACCGGCDGFNEFG